MASEHLRLMQCSGFLSQEKEGTTVAKVDWLFYDLSRDKARNKRRGETIN